MSDKSARGIWIMRDQPAVVWLVAAIIIALVHPFVPESRWLMIHLVLLGAITHSIMVWSSHFTQTILKTRPGIDERKHQSMRLTVLLVGVVLVLLSVPFDVWVITVVGAVLVVSAVAMHVVQMWRQLKMALPSRFKVTVHYYFAAAASLPVGVLFGVLLARGLNDDWHGRLLLAHSMVNVLGWVGFTVAGTLVTLWPTVLRTKMDDRAVMFAAQALPLFISGLITITAGALLDQRLVSFGGFLVYGVGWLWWARALITPARTKPPREFASASIAAAIVWWLVGFVWLSFTTLTADNWGDLTIKFTPPVAAVVVGFAVQLLTGALSYLVPMALGGGPQAVRASLRAFNTAGAFRLIVINAGLVLSLLPVPSAVRVIVSVVVLVALALFIPLMFAGARASLAVQRGTEPPSDEPLSFWRSGPIIAGVASIAVAITIGVGYDPAAAGLTGGQISTVASSGQTTKVTVVAEGMTFTPNRISVPKGNRLVITLINKDEGMIHDLTLGGEKTPRLAPGDQATLEIDAVGEAMEGWCTVIGHREMGMVFNVDIDGEEVSTGDHSQHGSTTAQGNQPTFNADMPKLGTTVDPVLPALSNERIHKLTLRAQEVVLEVAPGVKQRRWTFNGGSVGPTLHGRVGDVFEVTLINDGTMGHSIDFHAGSLAPDKPMRTIAPGESLVYRFTAERAGIWMYHCSTHPMSSHIAAGMHGAVVIEPEGLEPVDRSYVLVQSEIYLQSGTQAQDVNAQRVSAETPDAVVFNGVAYQYHQKPFAAKVGERVRFWVLDAGPNRSSAFHIVGGQFDTVYKEGAYSLRRGVDAFGLKNNGSQVLGLLPAQGGFVELVFPETGNYPVVSHLMIDAERGAKGTVAVTQ